MIGEEIPDITKKKKIKMFFYLSIILIFLCAGDFHVFFNGSNRKDVNLNK
jgi:hypothetical protein